MVWVYIIVGVVIDVIVSLEFNEIAHMKGYTAKKYFWYCLLLGLFAPLDESVFGSRYHRGYDFDALKFCYFSFFHIRRFYCFTKRFIP